ncbi:MAG TPA: tRNA (adenosine(37)-N6)-dimethylallyltransferase MiaA [Dehalococcoidia bacterium]|jgi:tRNA dimethylallyltransferase|nr:tRNA (adenosine(37)-N6)-dimethylallyltransferase MiaA [Dehalococcoidia bacterium]
MKHLVAIVGPTGIGKSRLALRLAQVFHGEIVSADSRQVYRYMDIGTAKPSPEERALVPHHLIDLVDPDQDFSLAQYQALAYQAIKDIQQRHKLPLLVGGSGLYIWAVLEGWKIPSVPPDPELRRKLEGRAARSGADELYRELARVDPAAAQRIDPRNVRRVIRALEVHYKAQKPFSRLQAKEPPPFHILIIGLTAPRDELYRRVDLRVDAMLEQGLVAEVEKLLSMGYHFNLPSLSSIGYKQIGMFLRGELTLAEAAEQIKAETHRLVRHQYAWFRLNDKRIHWFDVSLKANSEIEALLTNFLKREQNNQDAILSKVARLA